MRRVELEAVGVGSVGHGEDMQVRLPDPGNLNTILLGPATTALIGIILLN